MVANMVASQSTYEAKAERLGTKHVGTACEQHVTCQQLETGGAAGCVGRIWPQQAVHNVAVAC